MSFLPDRALLVKLFYQNDNSAIVTLRKFRTLKGLRKGPLTAKNLRLMVTKFEETGSLNVRSGRGKNCFCGSNRESSISGGKRTNHPTCWLVQVFAMWQKHWMCSFNCPEDHAKHLPLLSIQASTCAGIAST
ncbi:hypothetical protein TNCV_2860191 [Trichonephila clavipes]|nr:hypothetical protein TNCV_2860191 [Trichonephila clavipes]